MESGQPVKLSDCVEVYSDTDECVILDVLPDHEHDLYRLGFSGSETMFRLSKGGTVEFTVYQDGQVSSTWLRFGNGLTLYMSELERKMTEVLQNCVEQELGIKCMHCSASA